MIEITEASKIKELIETNKDKSLFFFKHSYRCPICARALEEYKQVEASHPEAVYAFIDVVKDRQVSNQLAQESKVMHESPQVILYKNGKVVWSASHGSITKTALEEHLQS